MVEADNSEIRLFKKQYCGNEEARKALVQEFNIEVESVEEALPWKNIISYAGDEKYVKGEFVFFKTIDYERDMIYYPVFSMEKARELAASADISIPPLKSIYLHLDERTGKEVNPDVCEYGRTGYDNMQLRRLILCMRSMMLLHIDKPKPMKNAMKAIYDKMEKHPRWRVRGAEVKAINTALGSYLKNDLNRANENFQCIQDYLIYLQDRNVEYPIKEMNFEGLREILLEEYGEQEIFF